MRSLYLQSRNNIRISSGDSETIKKFVRQKKDNKSNSLKRVRQKVKWLIKETGDVI